MKTQAARAILLLVCIALVQVAVATTYEQTYSADGNDHFYSPTIYLTSGGTHSFFVNGVPAGTYNYYAYTNSSSGYVQIWSDSTSTGWDPTFSASVKPGNTAKLVIRDGNGIVKSVYYWQIYQANRAPTSPGNPTASSVTTSGATVSWGASTDPDGDTITYEVYYARAYTTDPWTSAGTTANTSKAISGLAADQGYSLKVVARDGRGLEAQNINTGAFTTPPAISIGLTIITHGFQFTGDAPFIGGLPNWVETMAAEIIAKKGGGGKLIKLEFDTGNAYRLSGSGSTDTLASDGETVLILDWAGKSNNSEGLLGNGETGWREAAGDYLANYLLHTGLAKAANDASKPIHFIAHSFGTVVNSEAIRRLGLRNISVARMTTLDPHDQNQDGIPDAVADPSVKVWSNVLFADNYWQDNAGDPSNPNDNNSVTFPHHTIPFGSPSAATVIPVGRQIAAAWNRNLTTQADYLPNDQVAWNPHSRVWAWFYQTIRGTDYSATNLREIPGRNWYPGGVARTEHGFGVTAASSFGSLLMTFTGGSKPDPASAPLPASVFNGDFEFYNDNSTLLTVPGYSDSDGPRIVFSGDASHGRVASLDLTIPGRSFRTRPIYFPGNATVLVFEYNVQEPDDGDALSLLVVGYGAITPIPVSGLNPGWRSVAVAVPDGLKGKAAEVEFSLTDPGLSTVDSRVWVDNIRVDTTTPADVTLPVAALAGSVNPQAGATTASFTVNYTDNVAIKGTTIGTGDLRVTGPNGFDQAATLVSVDSTADGLARIATYSVPAPGGTWDLADNGSYNILMEAAQVTDTSNNPVPSGLLGTFQVGFGDTTLPTVSLSVSPVGPTFTASQTVTLQAAASDNVGIKKVEFYRGASLVRTDTTTPYTFDWEIYSADNGSHNWTARAFDLADNQTTSAALQLTVNIAPPPPAPPVITSATYAPGTVGQPFSYQILASNTPIAFNATGLPAGLRVNTGSGLIYGTPTAVDTNNVTISASNAGGTGTATLTIKVTEPSSPSLSFQPLGQTVSLGQTASFTVAVTGSAPLSYQWRKGGIPISGATNSSLVVSNADWRMAGAYTVLVTNAAGMALSRPAHLQVGNQTVVSWGNNQAGQTNVPLGLTGVVDVAGGSDSLYVEHSLALKSDGTVVAWGGNSHGQSSVPRNIGNAVAVAAGFYQSVALNSDGKVLAWGSSGTNVPAEVHSEVVAIAAGYTHFLALKGDGTVFAWGDPTLTTVPGEAVRDVVAIAAGAGRSLALKRDGSLIVWTQYGVETSVPSGLTGLVAVAGGLEHSLALRSDGVPVAWGRNDEGQTNVPTAAQSEVVGVAAGFFHSLALRSDGTVVAWGGFASQTNVPATLGRVVRIAAGGHYSLAIKSDAVPPAPVITAQPLSLSVSVGQNASFIVAASDTAPLSYQWQRNGQALANAGKYAGVQTATLTISNVTTNEAGTYTVVVTNLAGTATSSPAALTVNRLPQTITFFTIPTLTLGGGSPAPDPLIAYSSSGRPVYFVVDDPTVALVDRDAGFITLLRVGTTTVSARQDGDATYLPADTVIRTLTVTAPPPGPVLNPANGHYYELIPAYFTWSQARIYADARVHPNGWRGHLVTIQDAPENAFVSALITNGTTVWIGGFQPAGSAEPADGWRWVTGEPMFYTNWQALEPNNSSTGGGGGPEGEPMVTQNSMALNGLGLPSPGSWQDDFDTAFAGLVVEYEPPALAFNPANGHYYELVTFERDWSQARADAEARVFTNG